jgi:protein TonB
MLTQTPFRILAGMLGISLAVHGVLLISLHPAEPVVPEVALSIRLGPSSSTGVSAPAIVSTASVSPVHAPAMRPVAPAVLPLPVLTAKSVAAQAIVSTVSPAVPHPAANAAPAATTVGTSPSTAPGTLAASPGISGTAAESVTPARFLGDAQNPPYPERSRQMGEHGKVVVRVRVSADGQVGEVTVVQSSGYPALDQSAADFVRRGPFYPAHRASAAIDSRVRLSVTFNLDPP